MIVCFILMPHKEENSQLEKKNKMEPQDGGDTWLLFCGGSGSHGIISELLKLSYRKFMAANPTVIDNDSQPVVSIPSHVSCVIPITDNGGSSQDLIDYFGGPAVGDCRNMLLHSAGTIVDMLLLPSANNNECACHLITTSHQFELEKLDALIKYSSSLTKTLKTREANKQALQDSFAKLCSSSDVDCGDSELLAKSKKRIKTAIDCYWRWESALSVQQISSSSEEQTVAITDTEKEFLLPPSATKKSESLCYREPVYYIGASTGNVLLFALFLEALEVVSNEHCSAISGSLEKACSVFWSEVLCVPAIISGWERNMGRKTTSNRVFPTITIIPSLDYYVSKNTTNLLSDTPKTPQDESTLSTIEHARLVRQFKSQELSSLSTAFVVPPQDFIKPLSTTSSFAGPSPFDGQIIAPLPFARLDILLSDGSVIEGQKEFSYGLGPTPHGTPIASRSSSLAPHPNSPSRSVKTPSASPTTTHTRQGDSLTSPAGNTVSTDSFSSAASSTSTTPSRNAINKHAGGADMAGVDHAPLCLAYTLAHNVERLGSSTAKKLGLVVESSRTLTAILNEMKARLESHSSAQKSDLPKRHIIFSRGSFFTSLGASCAPVASSLADIISFLYTSADSTNKFNVRFSLILNGSIDRETSLFFDSPPVPKSRKISLPKSQLNSLIEDKGQPGLATGDQLTAHGCPVKNALQSFFSSVVPIPAGQIPDFGRFLQILGVRGSRWDEGCHCHFVGNAPSLLSCHQPVKWITPKGSKFSSSKATSGGTDVSGTTASTISTMYDDEVLVHSLLAVPVKE